MAAFIKKIDSLFDIFNSSPFLESKLSKCALIEDSPSLYDIKMMKMYIQPPCIKCWEMSTNALDLLWHEL